MAQKDPSALAKKILLLLKDRELMQKLGNNGRKLVLEKFSMERMIDSVEGLYENLLKHL